MTQNKSKISPKPNTVFNQEILNNLTKEWVAIEKAKRRHELMNDIKLTGAEITENILKLILAGGVIATAIVAPNVLVAFSKSGNQKKYFNQKEFNKNLYRSKYSKYINFNKRENDAYEITITHKGQERALKSFFDDLKIKKEEKWAGKWWLVFFDIPRKHNSARNALRQKLEGIGMIRLQDSIFISPYNCFEEVQIIASIFNVSNYIRIAETNQITGINKNFLQNF